MVRSLASASESSVEWSGLGGGGVGMPGSGSVAPLRGVGGFGVHWEKGGKGATGEALEKDVLSYTERRIDPCSSSSLSYER